MSDCVSYLAVSARGLNHRIVGGEVAADGAWPHQGSLQFFQDDGSPGSHTCGLSLLTADHAITAAHCVGAGP